MTTPTYTSPFTGTVVTPTDVSYYQLTFTTNQQLVWPTVVNSQQPPAARIIDANAQAAGLYLYLPSATEGAVGSDILIRNLGFQPFTVLDAEGGETVAVPAGKAVYFYLTDNSTLAGEWGNISFGVGTSYADAATLAGYGLISQDGKLCVSQNVIAITAPPVIDNTSRASTYLWNGGAATVTLPSIALLTPGWFIGFRNNGTGAVTCAAQSPSTINGASSITVNPGESGYLLYQPETGNYFTIGLTPPSNIVFTSAVFDVDAIPGNTLNLTGYAPIIQTYDSSSGTRTQTLLVELPAITQLYILSNITDTSAYNVTFKVFGSSQAPLAIPSGQQVIVVSDGNFLYPITQSSSSHFFVVSGSAIAPAFSFVDDTTTGLYLVGSGILAATANGKQIMRMDYTNTLAPKVVTPAAFTATGGISGGTF